MKYTTIYEYRSTSSGFVIDLRAPESVKTFTYKPYVRTNDEDIAYASPGDLMSKGATFIIGAEVTVESPARPMSPWNFESSEQMVNWNVILCVGDTKFYAHKMILSFASSTFRSMFEGEFREKNQQEILVDVEGTDASHFEAFLQCLYPCGSEPKAEVLVPLVTLADFYNVQPVIDKCVGMLKALPSVSNIDKLRVAIKVNSTSLEDVVVIASLSKADVGELIAAGFKDLGDERWQKILSKCHSVMP
ncbi:Protein BATH-25 [Aphelenchoides avenae]|nr:Protein BATH-25 [Aphelenchus avenae]